MTQNSSLRCRFFLVFPGLVLQYRRRGGLQTKVLSDAFVDPKKIETNSCELICPVFLTRITLGLRRKTLTRIKNKLARLRSKRRRHSMVNFTVLKELLLQRAKRSRESVSSGPLEPAAAVEVRQGHERRRDSKGREGAYCACLVGYRDHREVRRRPFEERRHGSQRRWSIPSGRISVGCAVERIAV